MEKRFSRIIESGTRIAFAVMVLFAAFTFYRVGWAAGVIELAIIALVYVYYRARSRHRSAEIRKYVETLAFSVDDASKASMVSFPLARSSGATTALPPPAAVTKRCLRPISPTFSTASTPAGSWRGNPSVPMTWR